MILDTIDSPDDLKKLSVEGMEELADEIRGEICTVVSKNGGHLAPSLGVVELSIALHATYDCPKDKIVWDVGHQSYTHKILTGRREQFHTLRTEGGISGFPKITESEYDAFGAGHAGTAISAALGFAAARDIKGSDEQVVAVVGDGVMTCGLSFEGLNNAGDSHSDLLVILNDNKMSISPNVGALSNYLTDVISATHYNKLKKDIWDLTGLIPKVGDRTRKVISRIEKSLKTLLVPGVWFENLGFRYFGPVDGHNIPRLLQVLSQLKKIKGPLLLHVDTTKGKGYCYAEENATKFHGVNAFNLENGMSVKKADRPGYSAIMGDALVRIAKKNENICAITAAMTDSTGLGPFAEEFSKRFFDVGIAEGHAVTFAAGLARAGMKPFVVLYSSFLQRSYDNVIHDAALQKLPVVLCLDRAGVVGEDGPTHHGVFDISFLRQIPNVVVMAPKDENELQDMLKFAADYDESPISIRYPRGSGTATKIRKTFKKLEIGKAEVLREGKDAVILAIGEMTPASLEAAKILEDEGIDAEVVNMRFVRPLDTALLDDIASRNVPVVTVEENALPGGFGSAIMEYYAAQGVTPKVLLHGIPDSFVGQAARNRLLSSLGLDPEGIAEKVKEVMKR